MQEIPPSLSLMLLTMGTFYSGASVQVYIQVINTEDNGGDLH